MLRRVASGHIEATQLSKFAAASRIALAVIRGWPEAPSSPLHGGGALPGSGVASTCTDAAGPCADGAGWLPLDFATMQVCTHQFSNRAALDQCPPSSADT